MSRLILRATCLLLLVSFSGTASADVVDFVFLTSGQFGKMDLQTGSFSNVGPASATYEDMTRLPGGTLYAADSGSRLLTLDQTTGAISSVVGTMGSGILGAKIDQNGTLFGYNSSDLYTINTSNANATLVGGFGIATGTFYDAAFNGNMMFLQGDQWFRRHLQSVHGEYHDRTGIAGR